MSDPDGWNPARDEQLHPLRRDENLLAAPHERDMPT
jgi:hypothetical protein